MMEKIDNFRGEYYCFSNFSNHTVYHAGLFYKNSEAAFQAAKFLDEKIKEKFLYLNPSDAKKLGKSRKLPLRKDWEEVKDDIMYDIVRAKFSQHPKILKTLLETNDLELIEGNNWGDRYWGQVNGKGKNKLGKILMKLRDEFKKEINETENTCHLFGNDLCGAHDYVVIATDKDLEAIKKIR